MSASPSAASAAPTLADLDRSVAQLPGPDLEAGTGALALLRTRFGAATGRAEGLACWLATWMGRPQPEVNRVRLAYGIASHAWTDHKANAQRIEAVQAGQAPTAKLAGLIEAELQLHVIDPEHPAADPERVPDQCTHPEAAIVQALSYGLSLADQGTDLLVLGALTEGGHRLDTLLAEAAGQSWRGNSLGILGEAGGLDHAVIAGAIIGARATRVPVLLDGLAALAAAGVVARLDGRAIDHCLLAARPAEIAGQHLAQRLAKLPILADAEATDEVGVAGPLAVTALRLAAALVEPP